MGATRLFLLFFCLFLVNVSSVKKLYNTNDLRNTNYAKTAPRHGRQLLFWFAQQVLFDRNNNMFLNFDPHRGNYGFHQYQNREGDLPRLRSEESYYSVGNLNHPEARYLPDYVRRYSSNLLGYGPESNMDRLMVVLNQRNSNRIFRVYSTAHNLNRRDFNPADTYEIDPALISQIRRNYCRNNHINIPSLSSNTEGDRCHQFLSDTEYNNNLCTSRRNKRSFDSWCYEKKINIEIKTTTEGKAKLIWDNIPEGLLKKDIYIEINQNIYSHNTNEDPKQNSKTVNYINKSSGELDTTAHINAGLQPRLQTYDSRFYYYLNKPTVILYGLEFDGANKVLPIRIRGNDASLQLVAKDGKACARLYIKKTFSNWQDVFYYSWVGFYKSQQDKNDNCFTYQYAGKFSMIDNTTLENYNIYQYDSSLSIAPGVQIRFLLDKRYDKVLAKTTPWEIEKKSICIEEKHFPGLSSSWSFPEFFYEPDFYDANNVVPVKIEQYDAGLQLLTKEGKACARLYIKKTFTNWKDDFYYSWVGFYKDSQSKDKDTYEYAVDFEKMKHRTDDFDIYQYKSSLVIAPGMQIRFFKRKWDKEKLVETEPWKSD